MWEQGTPLSVPIILVAYHCTKRGRAAQELGIRDAFLCKAAQGSIAASL